MFRLHGEDYRSRHGSRMPTIQHQAMRAIQRCRTAALGGHVEECDRCGHRAISYNSCRNRNCPKCQSTAAKRWLEQHETEILPVPYFHVVFTVPEQITRIALGNQKVVYEILFRSISQTLQKIASEPKHLGGQIGFLAILHTWGQNLDFHPHIHCVVPGGALTSDNRWLSSRKHFLLPVAVLAKMFRGKFLAYLRSAFQNGKLRFAGELSHLSSKVEFRNFIQPAASANWVVYCKPPFGGPQQMLKYLARFTHRIAISNHRLLSLHNAVVSFFWKDYRDHCRTKIMSLTAQEFIRRFLMHIVPARFVRIRHYGFLSNRKRSISLSAIRSLIVANTQQVLPRSTSPISTDVCPVCKQGKMLTVEFLIPPKPLDSS